MFVEQPRLHWVCELYLMPGINIPPDVPFELSIFSWLNFFCLVSITLRFSNQRQFYLGYKHAEVLLAYLCVVFSLPTCLQTCVIGFIPKYFLLFY